MTTKYLVSKPTPQSVKFRGEYINLKQISLDLGLNHSYLSRIFGGTRLPSVEYAKKLAPAFNISVDVLLKSLLAISAARQTYK